MYASHFNSENVNFGLSKGIAKLESVWGPKTLKGEQRGKKDTKIITILTYTDFTCTDHYSREA